MTNADNNDMTKVWAYGKVQPGWYCAKGIWDAGYARHLEELGYQVKRSVKNPSSVE